MPWFERAVAAKEKGDLFGRVDFESLGVSLHEVGDCYFLQGQFAKALPWFEHAVAAKEKGDLYRRVDSESLAASVAAVASCRTARRDAAGASSLCKDS
jgi:hypothetical protein